MVFLLENDWNFYRLCVSTWSTCVCVFVSMKFVHHLLTHMRTEKRAIFHSLIFRNVRKFGSFVYVSTQMEIQKMPTFAITIGEHSQYDDSDVDVCGTMRTYRAFFIFIWIVKVESYGIVNDFNLNSFGLRPRNSREQKEKTPNAFVDHQLLGIKKIEKDSIIRHPLLYSVKLNFINSWMRHKMFAEIRLLHFKCLHF